jgi:hypothetical protein
MTMLCTYFPVAQSLGLRLASSANLVKNGMLLNGAVARDRPDQVVPASVVSKQLVRRKPSFGIPYRPLIKPETANSRSESKTLR